MLIVDLDNSLIKTDVLYESFFQLLRYKPWQAIKALSSIFVGKTYFKQTITALTKLEPNTLPYRLEVLKVIEKAKLDKKKVILISAANETIVKEIASYLSCFDECYGSNDKVNLSGINKAKFIAKQFDKQDYAYIGDSSVDLPVWTNAKTIITATQNKRLQQKLNQLSQLDLDKKQEIIHLLPANTVLEQSKVYLKAVRGYQWVKNLLLFIPAITANIYEPYTFLQVFIAFIAFCCIASSVYIINDIVDIQADRLHPVKKNRPLASGVLKINHGLILCVILFVLANIISLTMLPMAFFAMIIIYFILALIYSFKLKSKLIVDICTLSTLYTIRIIAGGIAAGVVCSPWLLAFSGYIFLSLAAIKRHTELVNNLSSGCAKALGTAYTAENIPLVNMIAIASGYISVLVLALYINNRLINLNIHNSYKYGSVLWADCPIIIYWLTRLVFISHSGKMNYDPLVYTLRDKVSLICMACIIMIFIISSF